MHYYIIGTKHPLIEHGGSGFKEHLQSIIAGNDVRLIAEEVNPNLPDEQQKSVGRTLAGNDVPAIPWLPIDMDESKQKVAGIYSILENSFREQQAAFHQGKAIENRYHVWAEGVRENYWIDCIEKKQQELQLTEAGVLITCGRNHLSYLAHKIRDRGLGKTIETEFPLGLGKAIGNIIELP